MNTGYEPWRDLRGVIVYIFRLKYLATVSRMKVLPNSNCHLNKQRLPALAIYKKSTLHSCTCHNFLSFFINKNTRGKIIDSVTFLIPDIACDQHGSNSVCAQKEITLGTASRTADVSVQYFDRMENTS